MKQSLLEGNCQTQEVNGIYRAQGVNKTHKYEDVPEIFKIHKALDSNNCWEEVTSSHAELSVRPAEGSRDAAFLSPHAWWGGLSHDAGTFDSLTPQ